MRARKRDPERARALEAEAMQSGEHYSIRPGGGEALGRALDRHGGKPWPVPGPKDGYDPFDAGRFAFLPGELGAVSGERTPLERLGHLASAQTHRHLCWFAGIAASGHLGRA